MGLSISNQLLGSTGLSVGLGLSRGNGLYFGGFGGGAPFTPAALFAMGEQGVWYDPSDFSTLFQDSAGTTPVTAVEQPVGLMLDLSKGLVLGSELVTNGTFNSNITGWTAGTGSGGTIAWQSPGSMRVTRTTVTTTGQRSISVISGVWYKITASSTFVSGTGNPFLVIKDTADAAGGTILTNSSGGVGASFSHVAYFLATSTGTLFIHAGVGTASSVYDFDNITAQSIAGNHATQATSAARPTLSARVNLLEQTEDLSAAYWSTTTGLTSRVTASSFTTLTENTGTSTHRVGREPVTTAALGTPVEIVCSFKAGTRRYLQFQWDNGTLAVGAVVDTQNWTIAPLTGSGTITASSITNLGAGEYQVSVTGFVSSGTTAVNLLIYGLSSATQNSVTYTGTSATIIAGKADLRVANDTALPVYQRVNTATDYNATGFPYYLQFDNVGGTNKSMATASIDFTATNKMTAFAGVRKLSDAASALVYALSNNTNLNDGWTVLNAPAASGATKYRFASKGTAQSLADTTDAAFNAPNTAILTGISDISADIAILRVNGLQAASSSSDQGTGNYGNFPLNIGRAGDGAVPLNGRIYSLIVRGAATSETQIGQTEQWISNEMGGGYYPTGFDFLVTADGDQLTDASGNALYTIPLYS